MPSADEISDSIEPGSLPYGDRQVMQDRIAQIQAQGQERAPMPQGQASTRAQERLSSAPASDLPITSGLSVGPGPGPADVFDPMKTPEAERYRLVAANARNPYMRHLARNALRALINRGT